MIKVKKLFLLKVQFVIFILILLTGCAAFEPAASIRVEVDVYKGPLSKPVDIQTAELVGIHQDATRSISEFNDMQFHMLDESCYDDMEEGEKFHHNDGELRKLLKSVTNVYLIPMDLNCSILLSLYNKSLDLKTELQNICASNVACYSREQHGYSAEMWKASNSDKKKYLISLTKIAAVMKVQSAESTAALIPFVSGSERVRISQNLFSTTTSEYGNLLLSRANALMIQSFGYGSITDDGSPKKDKGISRRNLHLNTFLADSSTTQAPRLFEWFNSKAPAGLEEWKFLIPGLNVPMTDRIRIYEEMFNDAYWSNVNTVYASGMGDVSMALIRDDIGNWNLKNFDNDPTELLGAYKDLTLRGIEAATKLMAAGASGGSTEVVQSAFSMANHLTAPMDATSPPNLPIQKGKDRIVTQIMKAKSESEADWTKKGCASEPEKADKEVIKKKGELTIEENSLTKDKESLVSQKVELANRRDELVAAKTKLLAADDNINNKQAAKEAVEAADNKVHGAQSKVDVAQKNVDDRRIAVNNKKDELNNAETAKNEINEDCKNILHATNNRIKNILSDYTIILDTLQEISIPQKTSSLP